MPSPIPASVAAVTTNAHEFASGTNPVSSSRVFRVRSLSLGGQDIVIKFDSVSRKTYTLEKSTGLAAGAGEAFTACLEEAGVISAMKRSTPVSYTHLRAH